MAFQNDKAIKTRKPHPCCWCAEQIVNGPAQHFSGVDDEGFWFSVYMHVECFEAMKTSECRHIDSCCHSEHMRGSPWAKGEEPSVEVAV